MACDTNILHLTCPTQTERRFSNCNAVIPGIELPLLDKEDIDHDLDLAPHLKSLRNVHLERSGACCVIQSDTEELGILAAAYIAAQHGAVYDSDSLDLHDYIRRKGVEQEMDEDDMEREMILSQEAFLPLCRLEASSGFFDVMPLSETHLAGEKAKPIDLPAWESISTSHPLILLSGTVSDEHLIAEIRRQTSMRSLTLVVLPVTGWRDPTQLFGLHDPALALAAELQFTFAAELVEVHKPAAASRYNQLLLRQLLKQSQMSLDARCRPQTLLKELETFRSRHDGVTNGNISKYVHLLAHLYLRQETSGPVVLTRQQALKPLAKTARPKRSASRKSSEVQLCGCENVKRQLRSVVDTMRIDRERRACHLPDSNHGQVLLFVGAPGTGKTTAARMLYQWLDDEFLLELSPDGHDSYRQVSGAQLKAPFVGHTAPMIHELFANYSFLFIDEAYALAESGLAGSNNDHFAQEAMGQLCIELENLPADHVVVFAGYGGDHDNRMRAFLNANPGLASRITKTIQFDPYSPDKELPEIFAALAESRGFQLPGRWQSVVVPYFRRRAGQEDFGSGREARRLLESCVTAQAHRLVHEKAFHAPALSQLSLDDLRGAIADLESGFRALQEAESLPCGLGCASARPDPREQGA